jgi:hypothetical protein
MSNFTRLCKACNLGPLNLPPMAIEAYYKMSNGHTCLFWVFVESFLISGPSYLEFGLLYR